MNFASLIAIPETVTPAEELEPLPTDQPFPVPQDSARRRALWLLLIVLAVALLNAGISAWSGIITGPDTLASYQVVRSAERGAPFNTVMVPASQNIGEMQEYFLAWWTPGQYVLPWGIVGATGLSLKTAEWLITFGSFWSGLIGLYILYRRLSFRDSVLHTAVAVPVMLHFGATFFESYLGGVTLTFAVLPWMVLAALNARDMDLASLVLLAIAGGIAFLLKSSALIMYAALMLFLLIGRVRFHGGITLGLVADFAKLCFFGAVVVLPAQFLFLTHGETPASAHYDASSVFIEHPSIIEKIAYPFAAITGEIWTFPAYIADKIIDIPVAVPTVLLAALNLFILRLIFRCRRIDPVYRDLLIAVVATFCGMFMLMFLRNAVISLETRHSREMLLIVIPGIVALLFDRPRLKLAVLGVLSLGFLFSEVQMLRRVHASQMVIDGDTVYAATKREDVQIIRDLDMYHGGPGTVLYLMPWDRELDLVVRHSNVYPLGLAGTGIPGLRRTPYFEPGTVHPGRAERLIVRTTHQQGEAELRKMFPEYNRFEPAGETATGRYWYGR